MILFRFYGKWGLSLLLMSVILGCFSACHTDTDEENEGDGREKPNQEHVPALEDVNYPDVAYELGTADYRELLHEAVLQSGSGDLLTVYDRLMACRDLFERGEGNPAFVKTLTLLGENWHDDPSSLSETEALLLSEIIYQASRSFFYERNEIFNPTCKLVMRGIEISKGLIHSENRLIRQVSLFQLARQYDVLEGLTNYYSQITSLLPEDQLLFASSNALYIKRELLGLKGAAVLRSLHNARMDNILLCDRGRTKNCAICAKLLREAYEEFEYLSWRDRREYGEFYVVALTAAAREALENDNPDLAKAAIEKGLALLTNQRGYSLEEPLPQLDATEGLLCHPSNLIRTLEMFIAYTDSVVYEPILKRLAAEMKSLSIESFEKAERPNAIVYDDLGDMKLQIASYYNRGENRKGQTAFQYISTLYEAYSLSQNELPLRTRWANGSIRNKTTFHSTCIAENQLRQAELKLNANVTSEKLFACAKQYKTFKDLQIKCNELLGNSAYTSREIDLTAIRQKLAPDEVWLTIYSSSSDREQEITLAVVTATREIVKPLRLNEKIHGGKTTVKTAVNQLENAIVNGEEWNSSDEALLGALAEECFNGLLDAETGHIVLSTLRRRYTRVWEAIIRKYAVQNNVPLKSLRHDNNFAYATGASRSIKSSNFLAMAPEFKSDRIALSEGQRQDLASKLTRADQGQHLPWFDVNDKRHPRALEYNTEEVREIKEMLNGAMVWIGDDATEQSFKTYRKDDAIIHIASHAFMNDQDVYRSGILLANFDTETGSEDEDNILYAYEIRSMYLNAELVVLSACETGISPKRRSGYDWSLGRAFMDAGCRNTLTSLWNVDDKATHDIIISFYKELLSGKGKAEALYTAKNRYIAALPGENPHYWLPLVLTGDNLPVKFEGH